MSIRHEPLNPALITSRLWESVTNSVFVEVLEEVTSTNDVIRDRARQQNVEGLVLLAEKQTSGKGRQGRVWHTPAGRNLALTIAWACDPDISRLAGMSLAAGAAIADALQETFDLSLALKWPNDMYLEGRKCGGILVETFIDGDLRSHLMIGVGLNVLPGGLEVDQPVTNLAAHVAGDISRNEVAASVINGLVNLLTAWSDRGFNNWRDAWCARDMLKDEPITVTGGEDLAGIASGVDETGALLVRTEQGMRTVFSGEASVRRNQNTC
jgi:BirA family biotin operon repressor/biotin-[acetyl-CoA-carboxylase] ligase